MVGDGFYLHMWSSEGYSQLLPSGSRTVLAFTTGAMAIYPKASRGNLDNLEASKHALLSISTYSKKRSAVAL